MKSIVSPVLAACLGILVPAPAAAQAAPPVQADVAARLDEAHAIIAIMFPPAERFHMIEKMQRDLMAQMHPLLPASFLADPGLKSIINAYIDQAMVRQKAVMQKRLPEMTEAMAIAYTHEFSLAELKDIHAFALSPSGAHYLTKSTAIVGDPAVAKVNSAMFQDIHATTQAILPELKDKLVAYLKAHPDVAAKIEAEGKAK